MRVRIKNLPIMLKIDYKNPFVPVNVVASIIIQSVVVHLGNPPNLTEAVVFLKQPYCLYMELGTVQYKLWVHYM